MKFVNKYNSIQDYLNNLYNGSCSLPNISVINNSDYNNTLNSTYPHSLSFINNELKENYNIMYFAGDNFNIFTSIFEDYLNVFGYSLISTSISNKIGLPTNYNWGCVVLNNGKVNNQLKDFNIGSILTSSPLKAIVLPDTIETISGGAFLGCQDLSYVKLPNKLSKIPANMFGDCISLHNIDLPSSIKEIEYNAFYMSGINKIEIPSSCETIGNSAIDSCPNLRSIKFKNPTYKRNKIRLNAYAFAGNETLSTIEIPNCETLEISYSAFFYNPLQSIYFYGNPNITIETDSGFGEDAIIPTSSYIYLPTNYKLMHNYDDLLNDCSSDGIEHIERIRHLIKPVAYGLEGDAEGVFEFIIKPVPQITYKACNINYDIYYTIKNGYDALLGKIISNVKIHLGTFIYSMMANTSSVNKLHQLSYTYNGNTGFYTFSQPPFTSSPKLQLYYNNNGNSSNYKFFYDGIVVDPDDAEGAEYYQFRSSNAGINSSVSIVNFDIEQPEIIPTAGLTVTPKIYSNAETTYDYISLGDLNYINYYETSGKQGVWQNCEFVLTEDKFIDSRITLIGRYIKDVSQHSGTTNNGLLKDTGYIRFKTSEFDFMNEYDTYTRIEIINTIKSAGSEGPYGFTDTCISGDSYGSIFNIYSSNIDVLHGTSTLKITVEGTNKFSFRYAKTGASTRNYFIITNPDIDLSGYDLTDLNIYDEELIYNCYPDLKFTVTENNFTGEIDHYYHLNVILPDTLQHSFYIIFVQNDGNEMSHGYVAFEQKNNYEYIKDFN